MKKEFKVIADLLPKCEGTDVGWRWFSNEPSYQRKKYMLVV